MNDIKAYAGRVILLGRLGENEYTRVAFDVVSNWLEQYPNASLSIENLRPGDVAAYIVPDERIEQVDNILYWTITNTELSVAGNGQCQLTMTEGNVVVKSIIYDTVIGPALVGGGAVPGPWEDWFQRFIDLANDAEHAASAAQASATDAADSARTASEVADEIKDLTADAETLPSGSDATARYDATTGVLTIGVPSGPAGIGVPAGGTAGQVLSKNSNTDYDTKWVNPSGGMTFVDDGNGNITPVAQGG